MFALFVVWFGITLFLTTMYMLFFKIDATTTEFKMAFIVIGLFVFGCIAVAREQHKDQDKDWLANGCPMYKSECGSRNPYACEQKAPKEGRNMIGDIAIVAYKTCNPTP